MLFKDEASLAYPCGQRKAPSEKIERGCAGSIILREQDYHCGVICFRDDPELRAVGGVIDREEPRGFDECALVGLTIVVVHVAPITGLMPLDAMRMSSWVNCDSAFGVATMWPTLNLAKASLALISDNPVTWRPNHPRRRQATVPVRLWFAAALDWAWHPWDSTNNESH